MDRWEVAALILAAIVVGMGSQAWVSWLDHQRRSKALDVIKAAIEAGREPPKQIYEQLEVNAYASMGFSKRPWAEAVVFGAVGAGFWIMFAMSEPGDGREKMMLVAALMSAFSVGCVALAVFAPGQKPNDDGR
ncbi:MAG TPA: DUF6249 domain-containing protein [Terricaulis sp.]|nr:DUF6249 domain-containing protein [Terricaulis sp.]HRP11270.1 DUF6249 domain-containing protein [Terricaulis sp.]